MERISVIGSSGSGKSTLAAELARRLRAPHVELDGIYHQPNWVALGDERFRERVAERIATDRWVVDGNYTSHGVAQLVWRRADTIVWLDPPRPVVMGQIIWRSLSRVLMRRTLWNGNRESMRKLLHPDPEQNVVAWAYTRFHRVRARYAAMAEDGTWAHLRVFRLRSRAEVDRFLGEQGFRFE